MVIPKINSAHGSDTRNILNRAIDLINVHGKTIQDLVAEGQLTPEQYSNLITTINGMIKSGEVDRGDLTPDLRGELDKFNSQLAQTATKEEVRFKSVKLELEDMSEETLGAMSGNASFNLLSIPQDDSVTPEKIEGGAEIYYKNLYRYPEHYIDGKYIDSSGAYVDNAVTGYAKVPVFPDKTYSYWRGNNSYGSTMNFVDSAGSVIQSIDLSSYINGSYSDRYFVTIQTPSRCAYVEFNVKMSTWDYKESTIFILGDTISSEHLSNPVIYSLFNAKIEDKETADGLNNVKRTVETLENAIDNGLINIPQKTGESKNEMDTPLIEGLYSSSSGNYTSGVTNWYCYNADNLRSDTRDYILEHSVNGDVRLLIYTSSGYSHNLDLNTNEKFTVPDDCTRFTINIALTESDPATPHTQFPNTTDFVLSAYEPTYKYVALSDLINPFSKWGGKTLHVFGDSNSDNSGVTVWHEFIENELGMNVVKYAQGGAGYISKSSSNDKLNIPEQIASSTGEADLIVIFAGGNDYIGSRPLTDFQNAVDTSYHDAIEKYPHATIVVFTQTRRENEGENNAGVTVEDQVNVEIEKAGKYSLPILNLYHAGNVHPWNTTWLNTYMPDGVHLSTEGHRKLKDKVIAFFNNL